MPRGPPPPPLHLLDHPPYLSLCLSAVNLVHDYEEEEENGALKLDHRPEPPPSACSECRLVEQPRMEAKTAFLSDNPLDSTW